MKIGVIPDVHGCIAWKKNVEKFKDCDKIVFLGDYVDSFNDDERGLKALENMKDIVSFAKSDSRVTLLVGNHDFENYWFRCGKCSGFQLDYYLVYNKFFEENADLFKIAVDYDGWVFSHAGFTRTWYEETVKALKSRIGNFEFPDSPVEFVNQLLKSKNVSCFTFSRWDLTGYGDSRYQSPLWVRPNALFRDFLFSKQVIGHTETRSGEPLFIKNGELQIVMCDTESHAKYAIIDTENLPEFLTFEEASRRVKEQEKKLLDESSRAGEKKAFLRKKYGLTKSEMNKLYLQANKDTDKAAANNEALDVWEHLEFLCKKEKNIL